MKIKPAKNPIVRFIEYMIKRTSLFKELESELSKANVLASRLTRSNELLSRENEELAERTKEISRRIVNVSVQRDNTKSPYRIIRIVMDIDSSIIERGFLHGNDATIIKHMGMDIGRRAAEEIRRANFQRWEF